MSIPSFSNYWLENTNQIGRGLDRDEAYAKVLKNFTVISQINEVGKTITYYKDGTMDLDNSRIWRATRDLWNALSPTVLQSDYNNHITNLKVFTFFMEKFADDCPLSPEQAKDLTDEMIKARHSLNILLAYYKTVSGKHEQSTVVKHLHDQIGKLEAKIKSNASRKAAHDYYQTKVRHLKDKTSEEIVERLSYSIIAESPERRDARFPLSSELRSMGILDESELTTFLAEYEYLFAQPQLLQEQQDRILDKLGKIDKDLQDLKKIQEGVKSKELEEAAKKQESSSETPKKLSTPEKLANARKEREAKKLQEKIDALEEKFIILEEKCIAIDAKKEDAEEATNKAEKLAANFKQVSKLKSSEQREEFIKQLKKTKAFPHTGHVISKIKSEEFSADMFKASPEQEKATEVAKILARGLGAVALGVVGYRFETMLLDYAAKMGDAAVKDFVTVLSDEKVQGTSLPMTEDLSALIKELKNNPSGIVDKMNQIHQERTKSGEKVRKYADTELVPIFKKMATFLAKAEKEAEEKDVDTTKEDKTATSIKTKHKSKIKTDNDVSDIDK